MSETPPTGQMAEARDAIERAKEAIERSAAVIDQRERLIRNARGDDPDE